MIESKKVLSIAYLQANPNKTTELKCQQIAILGSRIGTKSKTESVIGASVFPDFIRELGALATAGFVRQDCGLDIAATRDGIGEPSPGKTAAANGKQYRLRPQIIFISMQGQNFRPSRTAYVGSKTSVPSR